MPELTEQEIISLLTAELEKSMIKLGTETRELAKKQSDEYFQNNHTLVDNPIPHSFYYIISKLSESDQITFITEHITFIEDHDREIFLYQYMSPSSLSSFLSLKVIHHIHDISPLIFRKLITSDISNLFNGFSHQDYLDFYHDYVSELSQIDNRSFIAGIFNHNHWQTPEQYHFDQATGLIDLTAEINQKNIYDLEFISLILDKYSHKIASFSSSELLSFLNNISDHQLLSNFLTQYHHQIITAFSNISTTELKDIISEYQPEQQEIIFNKFYNNILKYHSFSSLIDDLYSDVIVDLCTNHSELLSYLTIEEWLSISTYFRKADNKITNILDQYEIINPEILFKNFTSIFRDEHPNYEVSKYLELKYRQNLQPTGQLFRVNDTTSLFSKEYLHNLTELNYLFKSNKITKKSSLYQQHLLIFIAFLKQKKIIDNFDDLVLKIVDNVFYRIIKGAPLSDLYCLSSLEGLTTLSRLGEIPYVPSQFTVNQLLTYNVKHHKKLSKDYTDIHHITSYQTLTLKLMLLIGYHHAKALLNINHQLPVLEHLVGPINTENITFDNQGNPILNQKIINLLFTDKNYSQIKEMLTNQDCDLYKYFPRIFNEWENIKINGKDKSLKTILGYLKGENVTLSPEYYRLEGLFKHIGSTTQLIGKTLIIHDQILTRTASTIPRVTGNKGEYSYEIIRLHDMEGLTVGNQTDCCFTVCGASASSLNHATTSPNGRIFVIRKNNQLIAHSWLWRNGDTLCFDNIEVAKKITSVDFFDVYLQAISEILDISQTTESPSQCLKNITIGRNSFDKPVDGISQYPCLVTSQVRTLPNNNQIIKDNLPQPLEATSSGPKLYSDAKYMQYLIAGTDKFNFGAVEPCYQDDRPDIMHYQEGDKYSSDYLSTLLKKLNYLKHLKAKKDNALDSYILQNITDYQEIYCNDDWYFIINKNGQTESYIYSYDHRANDELLSVTCQNKPFIKKRIKQ